MKNYPPPQPSPSKGQGVLLRLEGKRCADAPLSRALIHQSRGGNVLQADPLGFEQGYIVIGTPSCHETGDDRRQLVDLLPGEHSTLDGPVQVAALQLRRLNVIGSDHRGSGNRYLIELPIDTHVAACRVDVRAW